MAEQKPIGPQAQGAPNAQRQERGLPPIGSNVICRITKILNYGVFVELVEFNKIQGFVHISQVAPSWIKNIRNFVKENQVRVGKVMHIDMQKGQVDVSFNKVSEGVERAKLEDYRQFKRSQKLLEVIARQGKADLATAKKEVQEPLEAAYGSLFDAFQAIAMEKESALEGRLDRKWFKPVVEIISKSVAAPEKTVKGKVHVLHNGPDGAEAIRGVLSGAISPSQRTKSDLSYLGSGKWLLKVTSNDFKESEKALKQIAESIVKKMEKAGGTAEFEKVEE